MRIFSLLMVASISACSAPKSGVLLMAHGGSAAWNQNIEATVAPLRDKYPIEIAFGMAKTSTIREGVRKLEDQGVKRIAVVRMFVSGDSFIEPTEVILGMREAPPKSAHASHGSHGSHSMVGGGGHHMETPERIDTNASFIVSRKGVGESPLVSEILVDRVKALSTKPTEESVLILAHGPADEAENERWLANMRLRAQQLHQLGGFRHIQCETLREDWPERRAEAEKRIKEYVASGNKNGGRVIVVPFRIGGFGPYREVLEGLDYVASERGFCPHPNMTSWIEQTAEECLNKG